ncbi:hypothetical protein E4U21_002407 [Claviceps maximensis]|nr:hypothetical protein E4U21_002407 [Claviceps maximensis]
MPLHETIPVQSQPPFEPSQPAKTTAAHTQACGIVSSPQMSDPVSFKKTFSTMFGSRRCSAASTPAESRRASAASSVSSKKNKKDNKIKLPTMIMPTFRFVN